MRLIRTCAAVVGAGVLACAGCGNDTEVSSVGTTSIQATEVSSTTRQPDSTQPTGTAVVPEDTAALERFVSAMDALPALQTFEMFHPPFEQLVETWADYMVIGEVRGASRAPNVQIREPSEVACEGSEGVFTGETCIDPGADVQVVSLSIDATDVVALPPAADDTGDPPVPGTLEVAVAVGIDDTNTPGFPGDPDEGWRRLLDAAPVGARIVVFVNRGTAIEPSLSVLHSAWALVGEDGTLYPPRSDRMPPGSGITGFRTLDELLASPLLPGG